jgi:hypothetical protein
MLEAPFDLVHTTLLKLSVAGQPAFHVVGHLSSNFFMERMIGDSWKFATSEDGIARTSHVISGFRGLQRQRYEPINSNQQCRRYPRCSSSS